MNFWREFLTAGKQGKYSLFSIWISICRNRAYKDFENQSKIKVFMAKYILTRDFALAGEIIHVHKFSF